MQCKSDTMMKIEKLVWEEKYRVGIHVLDEQHKQLFSIINRFGSEIKIGITEGKMNATLTDLRDYCILHFTTEEKIVKEKNLLRWKIHEGIHQSFVEKLNQFMFRIYQEPLEKVSIETYTFLFNWLKKHVLTVDLIDLTKK